METLLVGSRPGAIRKTPNAHRNLLLSIIGFQRRQRTDHRMSYAKGSQKGTM